MPRCEVLMFCIETNWNDLKTRGLLEHLSYDFVHPCEVRGHVILSCCPSTFLLKRAVKIDLKKCLLQFQLFKPVFFVFSRFSTNAVSLRKSPEAADNLAKRSSSSLFSVILKSFCCLVRSSCK